LSLWLVKCKEEKSVGNDGVSDLQCLLWRQNRKKSEGYIIFSAFFFVGVHGWCVYGVCVCGGGGGGV